jgi:F0F1-type ATP synthase delta subunit
MKVLQDVKTYKNLQVLVTELNAVLLGLIGRTQGDVADVLKKTSPRYCDVLLKYLEAKEAFTREKAARELEALAKSLKSVNELELTLAVNPTEDFVSGCFAWVQKNVGEDVVLNIKKDPALVGGAKITYKGKYLDYSLARKLKEQFVQIKEERKT